MATYNLQKMFKWAEKINEKLKLVGENKEFKFWFNKGVAPHLIGVQYMKLTEPLTTDTLRVLESRVFWHNL